jgi:hypothetical protein
MEYNDRPVPVEMSSAFLQFESDSVDVESVYRSFADAAVLLMSEYIPRYDLDREESLMFTYALFSSFRDSAIASGLDSASIALRINTYTTAASAVYQSLNNYYDTMETKLAVPDLASSGGGESSAAAPAPAAANSASSGGVKSEEPPEVSWSTSDDWSESKSDWSISDALDDAFKLPLNKSTLPLRWITIVSLIILYLLTLKRSVVIYKDTTEAWIITALSVVSCVIAFSVNSTFGFILLILSAVWSCYQSISRNPMLGIVIGSLRMVTGLVVVLSLVVGAFLVEAGEPDDEAAAELARRSRSGGLSKAKYRMTKKKKEEEELQSNADGFLLFQLAGHLLLEIGSPFISEKRPSYHESTVLQRIAGTFRQEYETYQKEQEEE